MLRRLRPTDLACMLIILFVLVLSVWVLVSGVLKFADADAFQRTVYSHGALSESMSLFVGQVFPTMELIVGSLCVVLVLQGRRGCAVAGQIIGVLFLMLGGYALIVSIHPPAEPVGCGCGWSSEPVDTWSLLALRNCVIGVLVLCCSMVLLLNTGRCSVGRKRLVVA